MQEVRYIVNNFEAKWYFIIIKLLIIRSSIIDATWTIRRIIQTKW